MHKGRRGAGVSGKLGLEPGRIKAKCQLLKLSLSGQVKRRRGKGFHVNKYN